MQFENFDGKQNLICWIIFFLLPSVLTLHKLVCTVPLLEGKYNTVFLRLVRVKTLFSFFVSHQTS